MLTFVLLDHKSESLEVITYKLSLKPGEQTAPRSDVDGDELTSAVPTPEV